MSNPNSARESPETSTVQEKLKALKEKVQYLTTIPESQKKILENALQKIQSVTPEARQKIAQAINGIGELATAAPAQLLDAINAIGNAFRHGQAPTMPAAFKGGQEFFAKASTLMEQLKAQFVAMGYETIKMIAGFFGGDSLLGKIFHTLKNDAAIQVAYVLKKYGDRLDGETEEEKAKNARSIVDVLQVPIDRYRELRNKTTSFDIDDLLKMVVAKLGNTATLEKEKIEEEAQKIVQEEERKIAEKQKQFDEKEKGKATSTSAATPAPPNPT